MRSTTPQERATAAALAGLVLVALVIHVVTKDSPGPGVFSPSAIRADLLPLVVGAVLIAVALACLRVVFSRRALRSRVQFELLPADPFQAFFSAPRF